MKYLESLHSAASSRDIAALPADPVNPVAHFLVFHLSGGYSLRCGSKFGTIYTLTPLSLINERMASKREFIVELLMVLNKNADNTYYIYVAKIQKNIGEVVAICLFLIFLSLKINIK